jgi:hypothetical protein
MFLSVLSALVVKNNISPYKKLLILPLKVAKFGGTNFSSR